MNALTSKSGGPDDNDAQAGHLIETVIGGGLVHSLTSEGSDGSEDGTGRGTPIVSIRENQRGELTVSDTAQINTGGGKPGQGYPCVVTSLAVAGDFSTSEGVAQTVRGAHGQPGCIVQPMAIRGRDGGAELEIGPEGAPYNALRAGDGGSSRQSLISINDTQETTVRRLTELECERLQGFPDGHTAGQSGAARYRQLGNAVAVPCVEWLVGRLVTVDAEMYEVDA